MISTTRYLPRLALGLRARTESEQRTFLESHPPPRQRGAERHGLHLHASRQPRHGHRRQPGHDMFSYGYTGSGGTASTRTKGQLRHPLTSNLIHHTKTSALSQHYGRENFFHNNIFAFSTKPESSVAGRWRGTTTAHSSAQTTCPCGPGTEGCSAWRGPGKGRPAPHDLVFGSNLWWSPDPVATNAFNGGTWEKWHAEVDNGSILADPLFRDCRQKGDWRLKPESYSRSVSRKVDYTLAGVRMKTPLACAGGCNPSCGLRGELRL